jgi:DNA-binding transcriptional LysR family regulator
LPRLQLELVPEATSRTREALRAREVYFAIVHELVEHSEIDYAPLFNDELVALVPAAHLFATRSYLGPEDFREQHLVLHGDPERSATFVSVLASADVAPAHVSRPLLTEAIVETV